MGWVASAGGFFGFYTTMYRFGFSLNGLIGLLSVTPALYSKEKTMMWDYNNTSNDPYLGNYALQDVITDYS